MEDRPQYAAEQVLRWALDEMRYAPDGKYANAPIPTINQLKRLCRSNTIPVWEYFVSNIKSKRTVDTLRGNIEWNDKMRRGADLAAEREAERKSLLARRDQLQSQTASGKSTAEKLNFELEKIKQELKVAERLEQELRSQVMELETKKTMLDGFDIGLEDSQSLMAEYIKRFKALYNVFIARSTELPAESLVESSGSLETQTGHKLRKACEILSAHMEKMIQLQQAAAEENRPVQQVMDACQQDAAGMTQQIESLLADIQPRVLLYTMIEQAKKQAEDLSAELAGASASAKKEAETIRRQLEEEFLSRNSRNIIDTHANSQQSGVAPFPTTERLLQLQREEHFARYVATERARNEAHAIRKQTQQLQRSRLYDSATSQTNDIDSENDSSVANAAANRELSLIEQLQQVEIELAAEQAALQMAKQASDQLIKNKELYERDMKQLEEKQIRISELDAAIQMKQELVEILLQQNASARAQLLQKIQNLRKKETNRAVQLDAQIRQDCAELRDGASKEVQTFLDTPLRDLAYIPDTKERYADLSINSSSKLGSLMAALGLPASGSAEECLKITQQMVREIDSTETELVSRREEMKSASLSPAVLEAAEHILSQADKVEQDQLTNWLPVLESQIDQTKKAADMCQSLQGMVEDWWDQPAQQFAGWVQVDGHPFSHWLTRWRELCHKKNQSRQVSSTYA